MEKSLREKLKEVENLTQEKASTFEASISDLTEGVSIITDVISDIPKTIDEKVSKVKSELDTKISNIKLKKGDKGDKGENGKDGNNGLNGLDGLDGSPDKPKDIVKKLESLKGDSRLDKKAIKGLDKVLEQQDLDRAISILDQRTQYLINKSSTSTSGGGAFTSITGTPTEVAYFDLAGNGTSDSLFTRDETTLETIIKANGTIVSTTTGFTTNSTGANLIWEDAGTSETAQVSVYNSTVPGQAQLVSTYEAPSDNILMQSTMNATGFSQVWYADTTSTIVDQIIQSDDVLGSGSPGTALARYDSSTSEVAVFGTSTAGGVINIFGSTSNPDDTITSAMTVSANIDGGVLFTYEDTNTGQRSRFRMNTNDGNLLAFKPNITGDIEYKVEQSNDILGLGALTGSALTWQDTSTQVYGIVGAVDGTATGLFPGSIIMSTNNNATGASSSIATNYNNVLNIATAVANVSNGDFDSGFEFDDGRMVVRYRNTVTGLESVFETDATSAVTRYTADGTTEYSTQLSDGLFQFFNSTTADQYMALGASTGIYQFGDISGALNSTVFIVNDTAQIITAHVDGVFSVEDGLGSSTMYIDAANRQSLFGNVSTASGIKVFIDEANGITVQAPAGVVTIGANTHGNGTNIIVDDITQIVTITNVPTYANDAAATGGGLATGNLYKTTTGGITSLNIVP